MKFKFAIAIVLALVLLAGCAGANIGLRTTNSPALAGNAPPPGSSYYSSSVGISADVSPGAYFGLVFLGYMIAGIQDNFRSWGARTPPEMAVDRAVDERDCRQPLDPLYANLRCK